MPYDHWWPPFHLEKMSDYYTMPMIRGRVTENGRYEFDMIYIKVRGNYYYQQRMYKGKWK